MSAPAGVRAAAARLKAWLLEGALPIWWERAADMAGGGYHDRLNLDGTVAEGPKRLRVQARQAYVYAQAKALGWTGPAKLASRQGINALLERRCADGLYRTAPDWIGPLDGMGLLYDQAFVLLALAAERAAFGDWGQEEVALRLVRRIEAFAQGGGYGEAPGCAEPLFANPNMHLFESAQAWRAASPNPAWRDLAAGLARLAQQRLGVQQLQNHWRHAVLEQYRPGWRAPASAGDWVIWPGHLYEWAFLLLQDDPQDDDARYTALNLIDTAERAGVDRERGVAMFALDGDFASTDRGARLWAQTERARACARAAALTGDAELWAATLQACGAIEAFLDVPTRGLWRDWMAPGGGFREEPAPASTLYHLVGAIMELDRQASAPT
ncbi:MAG TPA: AGE family epimerase/isomerase [Caulobacteraceae bacterium]